MMKHIGLALAILLTSSSLVIAEAQTSPERYYCRHDGAFASMPDGHGGYEDFQANLIEQQRSFWLTLRAIKLTPDERQTCSESPRKYADLLDKGEPFIANDENARDPKISVKTRAALPGDCLTKDEAVLDYAKLSGPSQVFAQIAAGYITIGSMCVKVAHF
jgi:hypothetical protein